MHDRQATDIAADLLAIGAVQVRTDQYFTWASGTRSPIYCDNRLTLSHPAARRRIAEAFAQRIRAMPIQPDVIAGCATAGIPHAAWVAEQLSLPMIYARPEPKKHGKGNQIEGLLASGQKVVVIEDLISTGGSAIATARAIEAAGGHVLQIMAIVTYGLTRAHQALAEAGHDHACLTDYDAILQQMNLTQAQARQLRQWRRALA